MLQDVRTSLARFGGITVLLAGDPRQCLPVVPKASPTQILDACIMNADFWGEVQILHLSTNMRLLAAVYRMTETELAKSREFADWLLGVGDGSANIDGGDTITLPDHLCLPVDSRHKTGLINHNADVDELNNMIIELLPGDAQTIYSADSVDEEDGSLYPTEYLNTLNIPGMPLHAVRLKVGCTAMLLRNMDPGAGLCNGTRLLLTRLQSRVLEAIILTGDHAGQTILLPRITLKNASSADLPLTLYRTQFPIRLAMAMTINKSQGQSLGHVGVCLENPVFSHRQLYVALSQASNVHGVKVLLPTTTGTQQNASHNVTDNIVFRRIFDSMA
ncbi:BQ5605_C006g04179 [Microbotryum silenes-dioicae]|uniref:ATP-dependent DNA helicase n=1 Tax=Microbotryum silenes-dioicae TaxID=796604 RepID=A0A2X0M682_9BASI|nr:BQ5605_C006g04179 [Microbotryum silenes-dioicae]